MEPKHKKLYDLLKVEILGGKYGKTQVFPSEAQLARRYAYSRTTIRKALDELRHEGFICSSQGKGTRVTDFGTSRTFGLILPGVSKYEYFQHVATELTRIAQERNCAFVFANVDAMAPNRLEANVREIAEGFIQRHVAGVIYHPIEFSSEVDMSNADIVSVFIRAKIPVVLLDSDIVNPPQNSKYDVVSIDNCHAAGMLTTHLLEAGARNVNVLMLPKTFPNMMDRVRGVAAAMSMAGRSWSPKKNVLITAPTNLDAIRSFMRCRERPDSFVCQDDAIAADFSRSLMKLGWRIPDDVMLAGFDGLDISRLMTPALTTIRQPYSELARIVFDLLLRRVRKPVEIPLRVYLPHTLIARASTQRADGKDHKQRHVRLRKKQGETK